MSNPRGEPPVEVFGGTLTRHERKLPRKNLAGPQDHIADVCATGEGFDSFEQELTVKEEFLPDDRVGHGDEDAPFIFDFEEIDKTGIGRTDDFVPVLGDRLLHGRHPDAIFFEDAGNQIADRRGFAQARPAPIRWKPAKGSDQVFNVAWEGHGGKIVEPTRQKQNGNTAKK